MRKIIISAALVTAVTAVTPAAAHPHHRGVAYGHQFRNSVGLQAQLDALVNRIRLLQDRGQISRAEERDLLSRADWIHDRLHRMERRGLTSREHREIRFALRDLRQELAEDRRDGRRWSYRDDRW